MGIREMLRVTGFRMGNGRPAANRMLGSSSVYVLLGLAREEALLSLS
jgi:hypothetical protein